MEKFNLKKAILENKATFFSSLNEGEKEYYKDAEADDAEHIDALEKDMEDDKKSSKMKTSELKAKIKEMVLAEMALDVDNMEDAPESEVDFLSEVDAILAEADEEVAVDDTEVSVGGEENIDVDTTTEVDPNVKAVQDALTQAQAAAQKLGDPKLTDQIGNTITFFTRAHVVDKGAVAEGKLEEFQKPEEDSNIEVLKKRYQFVPLEDLETIASKQDFKVWTIGSPDFDANAVQLGDYIKFPMDSEPALVFQADEQSVNAAYDNAEYSKYNRSLLKKMNREASDKESLEEALNKDIKTFAQDLGKRLTDAGFKVKYVNGTLSTEDMKQLKSSTGLVAFETDQNPSQQSLYLNFNPKEVNKIETIIDKFQLSPYNGKVMTKGWTSKQVQGAVNPGDIFKIDSDKLRGLIQFFRLAKVDTAVKSVNESMFPMLKRILK